MRHLSRAVLVLSLLAALAGCNKTDTATADATVDAAASAAAPTPAVGTEASTPAATSEDPTAGFELSMDKVDRYFAAIRELGALAKANPELEDAIAMNMSREDSLQFGARLESIPQIRAALAKAGISARDYALTGELLLAAMMAQGAVETGALKAIPDGLNPQAVEFVKQHKTELEAKFKALQAEG